MKYLEWLILALFLLLAYEVNDAIAYDGYVKMGTSAKSSASSKVFGLGIQDTFTKGFIYQAEADILSIPEDKTAVTLNGSYRLGVAVDLSSGVFATATTGPGFITQRDSYLGGYYQFIEDVSIGIKDQFNLFGVGYQHISSAGLETPNRGRDYFYFKAGVRF